MTRQEIIEEAKKVLPSTDNNIQPYIRIRVIDKDEYIARPGEFFPTKTVPIEHEVEFMRCFATKDQIITSWQKPTVPHKEVWIPSEYFGFAIPQTSEIDVKKAELMSEYLLKETV